MYYMQFLHSGRLGGKGKATEESRVQPQCPQVLASQQVH